MECRKVKTETATMSSKLITTHVKKEVGFDYGVMIAILTVLKSPIKYACKCDAGTFGLNVSSMLN